MLGNALSSLGLRYIPRIAAIPGVWGSPTPEAVYIDPRCTPVAGSQAVLGYVSLGSPPAKAESAGSEKMRAAMAPLFAAFSTWKAEKKAFYPSPAR